MSRWLETRPDADLADDIHRIAPGNDQLDIVVDAVPTSPQDHTHPASLAAEADLVSPVAILRRGERLAELESAGVIVGLDPDRLASGTGTDREITHLEVQDDATGTGRRLREIFELRQR